MKEAPRFGPRMRRHSRRRGGHGVLDPTPVGNAKTPLARIVAMLTKMTFA
jgi:hypothetical protein